MTHSFRWLASIAFAVVLSLTPAFAQPAAPNLAGASVSLPLSELRGLLDKNGDDKAPPVDFVYGVAKVTANLDGKIASIDTELQVNVLVDRWVRVELGSSAGVTSVTVGGEPAATVSTGGNIGVLLNGKTQQKAVIRILAERRTVADGPITKLELALPPSPLSSLSVTVPAANLEVKAAGGAAAKASEAAGKTTLACTYQGNQSPVITWRAKPADAAKLVAKISANTLTRVAVGRGVVRYLAEVNYDIRQGEVDTFKILLPEGVDFTRATGTQVRDAQVVAAADGKSRTLTVTLAEPVREGYSLTVLYEQRFGDTGAAAPAVALLRNPEAAADQGSIGLEVRGGGYELVPTAAGAQRVDVRELPEGLWSSARSPLLFGYRYDAPANVKIGMALTKHADVDVLVAMSDVCEAATTVTADGKAITKAMYVVRNNLKQFMTLRLPEGAQLWSAFVDDRPVTPVRNAKGDILIPLKKSETVAPDDDKSYRAQRENRRAEDVGDRQVKSRSLRQLREAQEDEPSDLMAYDVEIVYVMPAVKLDEKGQIKASLPQSDVPTGKVAWAVFLPEGLRVVDSQGNMAEVARFTLGFRHFAEAAWAKQQADEMRKLEAAQQRLQQAQQELSKAIGEKARGEGVLPVRVDIPISGEISRFEKLLSVDEAPTMTLIYRKKGS